jgi:sortase (surface protein transpeptidase)
MNVENPRTFIKNHFLWGVVLAMAIGGFLLLHPNQAEMPVGEDAPKPLTLEGPALTASEPTKLSIPKLNLETDFEAPLGLQPDNSIEVPDSYTQVGWYKFGPTPGEVGPAVILGHVDSYEGPAVFFSLGQLEVGDDIYVTRADGSTAHFKVSEMERNLQAAFPTVKVYGDINHAGLRLVTCSGSFDKGQQRYSHNLIVYAKLVE